MVGASQVGKTSILKRLCENEFGPIKSTTETISLFGKRPFFISPYQFNMDIYDTSGDQALDSLKADDYKDMNIGIIVFDMNNKDSLQQTILWKHKLTEYGPNDMVVGIAANKSEIYADKGMIKMEEVHETLNMKAWNNAILLGTSARANINVLELFAQTGHLAAQRQSAGNCK